MNRFHAFKIIVVLVACFSAILLAKTYSNAPASSQISTLSDKAPVSVPKDTASTRGQLLYENHCTVCHDSGAHIREHSKVHSLTDIRQQVYRWSRQLNLEWSRVEINDVADFLNQRFYRFSNGNSNAD